jgi:hypothetical protein
MRVQLMSALLFGAAPNAGNLAAQTPQSVTLSANPSSICVTGRTASQPNFDIVVRNDTNRPLTISEIKARSFDLRGNLIEQRILWQQALSLLGDQRTIASGKQGLVFNPFAFTNAGEAARIDYELSFDGLPAPSVLTVKPQSCLPKARLILPLSGRILIYDGYDFLSHHRRQTYQQQPDLKEFGIVDNTFRFAIDLVPIDAAGGLFQGDGSRIDQWHGWNQRIRAAGDGVVAAVRDDMPDNALGSEDYPKKRLSEDEMNADGNYVLVDHGNGEFSSFSHMKRHSVIVHKGQRVRAGQTIGRTGNSGATPIPHLHYELRSGWGVKGVRSRPAYFYDLQVLGMKRTRGPLAVNTGDVIVTR